jgi:D-glycero-alpha-D-manno-heptose 1-phosphate guanylyltransferase
MLGSTSEAIILAGGFGTRLNQVVKDVPKPMAPILGRPFLEYLLDRLVMQHFGHVVLSVGYRADQIIEHFGSLYKGVSIDYAIEEEALGTGGGLLNAMKYVSSDTFFSLNGDTLFDLDLRMLESEFSGKSFDAVLALRRVEDVSRYGSISLLADGSIASFMEKGKTEGPGLINGGVYLMHRGIFDRMGLHGRFSMEKDCLEAGGRDLKLFGVVADAYFIDIGVPEDYHRASLEFSRYAAH